jgi:putative transposase
MKKSRCTDSQIMDALKRAEAGFKVLDLCRELGISSALFYRKRSCLGWLTTKSLLLTCLLDGEVYAPKLPEVYIFTLFQGRGSLRQNVEWV